MLTPIITFCLLSSPGVVTKMKMQRTIVIRRDYLHYIRKYNRFEKRHKNMSVHLSPCFRCVPAAPLPRSSRTELWSSRCRATEVLRVLVCLTGVSNLCGAQLRLCWSE